MLRLLSCTGCAIALAVAPAHAQSAFLANLAGANENPPVASPGSGSALVLFDPAFQTMTVRTTFSGLTTPTFDAHIHCCVPPTGNAGVAVGFTPAGFPRGATAGDFNANFDLNNAATYNPPFVAANGGTAASARTALVNGTQGGLAYVNIHTTRFPGGEIRGQLVASQELSPQAYSLLPEVALQTSEFVDSTVRRYLRDVRGGAEIEGQTATLGEDGRIGMFLIAGTRTGEFKSRSNRPRVDLGSAGVIGGVDYRLGPTTLIGVMGGYETSDGRLTPNSRQSHVNSWFGGAYGSVAFGPVYVDLHASYSKSDYDIFRRIAISGFDAESRAEADSEQWMVAGTAGFSLQASGFEIEPYAGARYINLDLDAFTETGNIAALTIGATEIESLQSIAGLRVGAEVPLRVGSVRPSIRAEWRHEFKNDDPRLIASSFGGAAPLAFATTPLGDDHVVVGAGFSVSGGGPLSFVADYTGQLGGGYEIHAVSGGLRLTF
jgi:outer membrane autotransporter protein